jgi:hypothetical protein
MIQNLRYVTVNEIWPQKANVTTVLQRNMSKVGPHLYYLENIPCVPIYGLDSV